MASVDSQSIRTSTTESFHSYSPEEDTISTIVETFCEQKLELPLHMPPLCSTPFRQEEGLQLLFDEKHRGKNVRVIEKGKKAQKRKK